MPQVTAPRRDPAPSRWAYRVQRLWLTPVFRSLLRIGLPVFSVVFFAGWYFSDATNREAITAMIDDTRRSIAERPEFMVKLMAIDGASVELAEDIREVLPVDFPVSSFDLDLVEMQKVVAGLDAVASAELRIRPGGILQVEVAERVPAIVWRNDDMIELLDASGRRVAAIGARSERADLPLIVGEGADRATPEALRLVSAAAPIEDRLRGLVRLGERRWDVVLDRDQRIMLPEMNATDALEQVIALDQARDLLARDVSVVDMRNVERPTLRMAPQAVEELRRINSIVLGDVIDD
jgi:cell division protein FtsQ